MGGVHLPLIRAWPAGLLDVVRRINASVAAEGRHPLYPCCLDLMPSQPDDYDCVLGSVNDGDVVTYGAGPDTTLWFTNRWLLWEFIF